MSDNFIIKPSHTYNDCQKMQIDRKYGMFIHFGINTFNDTEWSDGTLPLSSYTPPEIDADGWVKNAKDAGMNYVILVTKHHDGFCLYDTKYTDYNINNTINKTDVVKAVAHACKKYGVQLGLYYSLWDRHEKCYANNEEYVNYMCNQMTELLDGRYGEICEFWLDGGWDKTGDKWSIPRLYDLTKKLQPKCAFSVNVSVGDYNSKGGAIKKYLPQNYRPNMPLKYFPIDFRLLDPYLPPFVDPKIYNHNDEEYYLPFQATLCIRDMKNWFWDPKYTQDKLLDACFIAQTYKQLTSQNNVLIVNVAPNIYGKQENADIERLLETAQLLDIGKYAKTREANQYDVIVVGGGPAGVGAAITSGRNGAKTLLIDNNGSIGGVSTVGLMSHWAGSVKSNLFNVIMKKSLAFEGRKLNKRKHVINNEYLKLAYIDLLKETNVDTLLYANATEVVKDGDTITQVVVYCKTTKMTFGAKVFIDATGDGDIAEKAGAKYQKGREDGKMQPCTLMFKVGGVRKFFIHKPGSFETKVHTFRGELQSMARQILPYPAGHVLLYPTSIRGVVTCNMTNITNIDATNPKDLTFAHNACLLQIPEIIKFLRKYARGYRRCYLLNTASLIGIRETRRIECDNIITENDIIQAKEFDNWIVKSAFFNFDVHSLTGAGLDETGTQHNFTQTKGYDIPYDCLTVKGLTNLLVAGRCISGTHLAHSNYRVMPICLAMGEGAGVAASLAIKENKTIREVNIKDIQKVLTDNN